MRLLIFIVLFLTAFDGATQQKRTPVVILTDIGGDTDDEQSMVRFLLYSNQFDVKAICTTSRLGHGQDTKPEIIRKQISAYRKAFPNLKLHSDNYPNPEYLESVIKNGQGDQFHFGENYVSEASDYIIKVIDEATEIVHIAIWGGQRELAQALWNVSNSRTKEEVAAFCRKIQVYAIGDQDKHRDWILNNFKDIRYIASGFLFPGNFGIREIAVFRGMYMTGDVSMQDSIWVKQNIYGHGELCECYAMNGHGTNGMKEGDSPSFIGLINNGLNSPYHPEWGGWGGRHRKLYNNLYIDASDFLNGTLNERHTISRWRIAFQNDFMLRAQWCVRPPDMVNHHPVIVVKQSQGEEHVSVNVNGGSSLTIDASYSYDPDKNKLFFNWFFYTEISFPEGIKLKQSGAKCSVKVPESMKGRVVHLILELMDNGTPQLTTYKRFIINII